ncbi:hypothetical protein [Pseudomonas botevensis]|uniref:hypothetical protein n=1 Tax=Pseudomonas botevensis TaxID=2842352 RepID=UPI001C3DBB48|nr:hypothetical protein [Pseudomonas botevensis]MBV4477639.1 hypothetical protein [Pseudomonas botevensis]
MEEFLDEALCTAVGVAVLSSQAFEKMFVLAARHAIKQAGALTIEDIVPVNAKKAFKQPVTALLKEISGTVEINGLEERLLSYIEDRHIVVHRLVEKDWSGEEGREAIKEICLRVTSESIHLHKIFTIMFGEWLHRFPNLRSVIDEYEVFRMYEVGKSAP